VIRSPGFPLASVLKPPKALRRKGFQGLLCARSPLLFSECLGSV
jgi:hypothetical protein